MKQVNNFEFYQTDLLGKDCLVVRDLDCQMERVYKLGQRRYLNLDSLADENEDAKVLITTRLFGGASLLTEKNYGMFKYSN